MPTERELSEQLDNLAAKLDYAVECDLPSWFRDVQEVANELRRLANEKYTPGSTDWNALKQQITQPSGKKTYTQNGKRAPF